MRHALPNRHAILKRGKRIADKSSLSRTLYTRIDGDATVPISHKESGSTHAERLPSQETLDLTQTIYPPVRFRWQVKIVALTIMILVGLVLCELGLNLVWHNPYHQEAPDRMLKLRLQHATTDNVINRSQLDPKRPKVRLRTDARSYILPSFQYRSPRATVAFLGGSTTECLAVQEELRFPALVSQILAKEGLKVNTLNAARSGNTIHDSLNVLLNHVANDHPDFVVLMHATNDIGVLNRAGDYRTRMGSPVSLKAIGKWALQIASSHSHLAALVRHRATTATLRVTEPDQIVAWRNDPALAEDIRIDAYLYRLKTFVHLCRDFGIEPILMTQPLSGTSNALTPDWADLGAQDRFNALIRRVGIEEAVLVIDLARYLKEEIPDWEQPMKTFYDGMHVTDNGSQVYAKHIAANLAPMILNMSPR